MQRSIKKNNIFFARTQTARRSPPVFEMNMGETKHNNYCIDLRSILKKMFGKFEKLTFQHTHRIISMFISFTELLYKFLLFFVR